MNKNKNIMLNEYNENEFENVYYKLWNQNIISLKYYICMLVNILLDYYILTYDDDKCFAEISDLFIFEFKKKNLICCMFIIFIICADKQN